MFWFGLVWFPFYIPFIFFPYPVLASPLNKTRPNFPCCRKKKNTTISISLQNETHTKRKQQRQQNNKQNSLSGWFDRDPLQLRTLGEIPAPSSSPLFSLQMASSCPDVLEVQCLGIYDTNGLPLPLPLFICLKSLTVPSNWMQTGSFNKLTSPPPLVVNMYSSL